MPGKDSFVYRTLRPWPNKRLKKAAIVGHTTTTATRLWFRTGDNGKFTVLIYESTGKTEEPVFMGLKSVPYLLENCPQGSLLKEFEIKEYEKDTTHVEDINRLKPNT
ncbi:MAG: hypothetical protein HOI47_29165, partial [Candidatus Scalindua sp.]|nr:hypothetical protein [Candidatus Scalindua sp.]